jgi:hypothetical protein
LNGDFRAAPFDLFDRCTKTKPLPNSIQNRVVLKFRLAPEVHEKFLDDDLEAGIRGICYTHDRSWAAELFADYLIGDRVTLSPGVTLFGANADTVLGQSRGNDMISLRVRISF